MKWLQAGRRLPGRSPINVIFWWTGVRFVVYLLLRAVYGLRMFGRENVPASGPVIYVANHQSFLDPPIIGSLVSDRPFASLARESLFRNPVFSWAIRQLGAIPLDQEAGARGDARAMKAALRELQSGRCLLIFPEGSRTPDGRVHRFQRGVLVLIRRAGVPVVPIAVEGAYDVWPAGRARPRLAGRLAVRAGEPIPHEELLSDGADAALERMRCEVDRLRQSLHEDLRRATAGRWPRERVA